ncbi:hypothetical protein TRFO_23034 [Tritrichomonas foetus]|uniref:Uncharacterized protein n=1 Tax=Tritrichomonas foetus TaxID=1144522 RepID=A0A1J4KAI2_9EUKA|nr:hypothetical protein TRFO_23034 [Tritrichomonas foetus]|eukprot:OHT08439.1 hypothetical protein TRFO_23034 [Tritrichomonas foetus]
MNPLDWPPIFKAMGVLGAAEGVSASVTAACLLGVSINNAFSITICVLLFIFAFVFGYVAYKSSDDKFMRVCSIVGTVLMPIAAISCILVDENFVATTHSAVKTPLYMILAIGILVNFTINIIQIIRICSLSNLKDRLLTNNNQVTYLFLMNVGVALILGLIFGLLKVEDRVVPTDQMLIVAIVFLFVGIIAGCIFAFFNEKETQKMQSIGLDPTSSMTATDYDKM